MRVVYQEGRGSEYSVQHNKVGHSKLAHMQQSTHSLLKHGRPEATRRGGTNGLHFHAVALGLSVLRGLLLGTAGITSSRDIGAAVVDGMLTDEQGVVLLDHPAQKLEEHDEQEHADAGTCKHAAAGDLP